MRRLHLLFAAALAATVGPATAQFSTTEVTDFLSDIDATIAKRDKDNDQKLSGEELEKFKWMLALFDKDHDGQLNRDEGRAARGPLSRSIFPSKTAEVTPEAPPPWTREMTRTPQAPRLLPPRDWRIGERIAGAALTKLDGTATSLAALAGKAGTVIALAAPDCPVGLRYFPTLKAMAQESSAKDVAWVFLCPQPKPDVKALQEAGFPGTVVLDPSGALLRELKAVRTTEVYVLDAARTLRYRGAIDDQYGLGYSREAPLQRYLAEALTALAAARLPEMAATEAPGCEIELPEIAPAAGAAIATPATVTWHGRVSRVIQDHCMGCHRAGGLAPFPLETPADLAAKAKTIRREIGDGTMPPWFAEPPAPGQPHWANDNALSAAEKSDVIAWLDGGRLEGDPAEAPVSRQWPDEWEIGAPDHIAQLPAPIPVKATGIMPYQTVWVDTDFPEERWVSAWQVRPTAPAVVHHVLVYAYEKGSRRMPGTEEKSGYFAAYVPGSGKAVYPPEFARRLPAGTRLRFEIHYAPNGKETADQMRLGMRFAKTPPKHQVKVAGIANTEFSIPAGAASHGVAATWRTPRDIRLLAISPHMHNRGKAFRGEVTFPGQQPRTLLTVPRYDFNWQLPCIFAEPPLVPSGSTLKMTGWFDNSTANPSNPDPAATVNWGSQTADEMMIGYVEYYEEIAAETVIDPGAGTRRDAAPPAAGVPQN